MTNDVHSVVFLSPPTRGSIASRLLVLRICYPFFSLSGYFISRFFRALFIFHFIRAISLRLFITARVRSLSNFIFTRTRARLTTRLSRFSLSLSSPPFFRRRPSALNLFFSLLHEYVYLRLFPRHRICNLWFCAYALVSSPRVCMRFFDFRDALARDFSPSDELCTRLGFVVAPRAHTRRIHYGRNFSLPRGALSFIFCIFSACS